MLQMGSFARLIRPFWEMVDDAKLFLVICDSKKIDDCTSKSHCFVHVPHTYHDVSLPGSLRTHLRMGCKLHNIPSWYFDLGSTC